MSDPQTAAPEAGFPPVASGAVPQNLQRAYFFIRQAADARRNGQHDLAASRQRTADAYITRARNLT